MTAKEKSDELIEKFYQNAPKEFGTGKALGHAKQCALIAVDEILKGDHLIRTPLSFWQKVKTEIEKL